MWFYAQYGRDAVIHIAFDVLDGGNDPDVWYEETGNSIYVLWLLYCRDSGFGQHELENVYWMQTAAARKWYLDSPVILISQRLVYNRVYERTAGWVVGLLFRRFTCADAGRRCDDHE